MSHYVAIKSARQHRRRGPSPCPLLSAALQLLTGIRIGPIYRAGFEYPGVASPAARSSKLAAAALAAGYDLSRHIKKLTAQIKFFLIWDRLQPSAREIRCAGRERSRA